MNKKSLVVLIIIVVVFIGALMFYIYANNLNSKGITQTNESINTQNNDSVIQQKNSFSFIDKDGNEYSIEDFENKPVALLLWRSDADGAIDLIEKYASYVPKYEEKITFLILNTGEKNKDIISIAESVGFGVKLYYNQDSSAMEYYGISKLPYMIFINEDGHVDSEKSLEDLDRDLDDYLTANLDLLSNTY